MIVRRLLGVAVGLLYPRCCPACGSMDEGGPGTPLCPACTSGLHRVRPPFCSTCGEMFPAAEVAGTFRCSNCAGRRLPFEFAIAPFENTGTIRTLIHRFKYSKTLHLRGVLATLLGEVLDDPRIRAGGGPDGWLLVPVPLHPVRRITRGFNQADELVRQLAKRNGLRRANPLRRHRWTPSQATLDRRHRMDNLHRAITLDARARRLHRVSGEHILVVDDVFTTGSTTAACARALTEDGGAEKVAVITLARG
ncbi:ComF family protein [soil metagenome]